VHTLLDAGGQHGAVPAQPDLDHGRRRVRVEAGAERAERRPLPSHTSSARTIRRVFVGSIFAAAAGSMAASRACSGSGPSSAASVVQPGPDLGPLPRQVEVVDHRPVVQAGAADQDRPPIAGGEVGEHLA
jgi:hypothetical protein